MADFIGHDIGRYHIVEQLGQGGMAVVYKAYDTRLEREVAIKVIRMETFGSVVAGQMLKRFEREGKSLAKMMHPNIVPIYDFGEHEGSPYLVMAYIPAGTLKAMTGQSMPCARAAYLLAPVARALAYAHNLNVIHRDVKPANILITAAGEPMLSDFGVAKILESDEGNTLTGTGVGIGTPEYMAPEQWVNQVVPQTDIYALGVVFYELVTGRKPYTADTPAAVLLKQANDPLPRPRQFVPDLPDQVEQVIYKALAKKPEDRHASMGDFAAALEKLAARVNSDQLSNPASLQTNTNLEFTRDRSTFAAPRPRLDVTLDARPPASLAKRSANSIRVYIMVYGGLLLMVLLGVVGIWWTSRAAVAPSVPGTYAFLASVKPSTPTSTQTLLPAATLIVTTKPTETITPTAISDSSLAPVSKRAVTPDPNMTSEGQLCAVNRNSDSTLPGYLDVLHFSASQIENDLTLIYTLRDLPEKVPVNAPAINSDDPLWDVSIDLDNNPKTGDHEGNEYKIWLYHVSTTMAQELVSIQDFKATLMRPDGNQSQNSSWVEISPVSKNFNFDKKIIILNAHLPERLAGNSKITISGNSGSAHLQPFICPRG